MATARGLKALVVDIQRASKLALQTEAQLYLGWVGRGNLGDDLMYQAVAQSVGEIPVAPLHKPGMALIARRSTRRIVIGGGTLIYRDEWGLRLERLLRATAAPEYTFLGTGVEDPEFALRTGVATGAGIERWNRLLNDAASVGVRGPRSAALVTAVGATASVVGDPGLLADSLIANERRESEQDLHIGLNLATVRDALAHDRQELIETLGRVPSRLSGKRLVVDGIAMQREDLTALNRLKSEAPAGSPVSRMRVRWLTGLGTLAMIRGCDFVLGERLHSVVFAAALGVPFAALAYKPKVYDFLASIDASALGIDLRVSAAVDMAETYSMAVQRWPDHTRSIEERKQSVAEAISGLV